MQSDLGRQAGENAHQRVRPLPVQPEGIPQLVHNRFNHLTETGQPPAQRLGPGVLSCPLGRVDCPYTILFRPSLSVLLALKAVIHHVVPAPVKVAHRRAAGMRKSPQGEEGLGERLLLGTGWGQGEAGDHAGGVSGQQHLEPFIPSQTSAFPDVRLSGQPSLSPPLGISGDHRRQVQYLVEVIGLFQEVGQVDEEGAHLSMQGAPLAIQLRPGGEVGEKRAEMLLGEAVEIPLAPEAGPLREEEKSDRLTGMELPLRAGTGWERMSLAEIIHQYEQSDQEGLNVYHFQPPGSRFFHILLLPVLLRKRITIHTKRLSIASYTVNGVANGTPAPGSTVDLVVRVRNTWGTITNATGTLSTSDPYVTLTTASTSYGSIDAYATATNATPFVFSVSLPAPYAHPMAFSLTISGAGGVSAVLPFTITTENSTVQVGGFITSDTTWTNDRVYEIVSNVQVNPGVTLTIQPGTQVRFRPGKMLQIAGTLIADGQPDTPIVFTSAVSKTYGAWGPINFTSTAVSATVDANGNYVSGSIIRNTRIEYGTGIGILSTLPYISDNTFISNAATYAGPWQGCCDYAVVHYNDPGGWFGGGEITGTFAVRRSTFIDNQGAAVAIANMNGKRFEVTDNLIIDQAGAGVTQGNIGWYTSLIARNRLIRTRGFNILGTGAGTVIEDNYVANSTGPGYTAGFGVDIYSGSPLIRHNVFANNGQGQTWCNGRCSVINIFSGGAPTVISNTFTGNWLDSLIYFNWGGGGIYQHNNWMGNQVNYVFYREPLRNNQNVTATFNYWGTTDTTVIDELIYDYLDDFNPGQVFYQPVLASPETSAPAFLWNVEVSPNPIGIQQATFILTFSRPMDQSINPTVTFGATPPYTTYVVLDNAQWLNDTQWRATFDITSLVPRGTYTISISGAKGADGMEIPTDTRFSFVVDYAGQITDQTPPNTPSVIAGGKEGDPSTVEAMWWASDPDSAITGYRYAIGSAPGATDIVNWTITSSTSFTRTGLGLVGGRQYWVMVQARNIGGLWSASGYSAFIAGQSIRKVFLPLVIRGH